jgi:hypothetical protein
MAEAIGNRAVQSVTAVFVCAPLARIASGVCCLAGESTEPPGISQY